MINFDDVTRKILKGNNPNWRNFLVTHKEYKQLAALDW